MSTGDLNRLRPIDDGRPLLLPDPPVGGDVKAFAVDAVACDNPDCPCMRMKLGFRAAKPHGEARLVAGGIELVGDVSFDGDDLKLDEARQSELGPEAIEWLREQMDTDHSRQWIRERWRRLRGQTGDPAYPSPAPPAGADRLISFSEVFPWDFDLTVVLDQRLYLVEDHYCLNPACSCDEVTAVFIDISNDSANLGRATASVRRPHVASFQGQPIVRSLWRELLDEHGPKPLQARFKQMCQRIRRVRRTQQRTAPAAPPQGPGRNEPCPCGSGKKYKRCCGV